MNLIKNLLPWILYYLGDLPLILPAQLKKKINQI